MLKRFFSILLLFGFCSSTAISRQTDYDVDVCVYGATAGGIFAAYAAKKMGKSVILISPEKEVGGMLSSGLGFVDIRGKYTITGLARDFFRRIGRHYGAFEIWTFEPHVAREVLLGYIGEAGIMTLQQYRLTAVAKTENTLRQIELESVSQPGELAHKRITAKIFIDCSYEGDLLAKSGITYTVGREGNGKYSESYNGFQLSRHNQLPDGIDPFKIKGDSTSGYICEIAQPEEMQEGTVDPYIPAFGFRICLTDNYQNLRPLEKPENYDAGQYELLLRLWKKNPVHSLKQMFVFKQLPNHKVELNSGGPFSLDAIGLNAGYFALDYFARQQKRRQHHDFARGLLYFYAHDERVPKKIRQEMQKWGLPHDEFTASENWPEQIYIREGRRMLGEYVMTESNCFGRGKVPDGIALAAGEINAHHARRLIVEGAVKNEGAVKIGGFAPWAISYRAITPRREEAANILVPLCLSASHSAWSSLRTEPVFMMLGQAAGLAAVLAIDDSCSVQQIAYEKLQRLLHDDPYLNGRAPEILIDNSDAGFKRHSGSWLAVTDGLALHYGEDALVSADTTGERVVQFSQVIAQSGRYRLYFYRRNYTFLRDDFPLARLAFISVIAKKQKKRKLWDMISGRTDWLDLGIFSLSAGETCTIELRNAGESGKIIADAVLLVPQF